MKRATESVNAGVADGKAIVGSHTPIRSAGRKYGPEISVYWETRPAPDDMESAHTYSGNCRTSADNPHGQEKSNNRRIS